MAVWPRSWLTLEDVFRRRSPEDQTPTTAAEATESTEHSGSKKGKPTPKRREAELARKARVKPPLTRREALKRDRQQSKERRGKARQAMAAGDQRYFGKRDQGPVRQFIRDYVDSRRTVAEFFLPLILVILLTSFIPIYQAQLFSTLLMLVTILMVIFDLVMLNRRVKREIRNRFPDDAQRGHGLYATARATQIRRLRLPKPTVRPGDSV